MGARHEAAPAPQWSLFPAVPQAEQFSYCQPWMLAWDYRKQNLLKELLNYNADIMCLQVRFVSDEAQFRPRAHMHALHPLQPPLRPHRSCITHCQQCASLGIIKAFALVLRHAQRLLLQRAWRRALSEKYQHGCCPAPCSRECRAGCMGT